MVMICTDFPYTLCPAPVSLFVQFYSIISNAGTGK